MDFISLLRRGFFAARGANLVMGRAVRWRRALHQCEHLWTLLYPADAVLGRAGGQRHQNRRRSAGWLVEASRRRDGRHPGRHHGVFLFASRPALDGLSAIPIFPGKIWRPKSVCRIAPGGAPGCRTVRSGRFRFYCRVRAADIVLRPSFQPHAVHHHVSFDDSQFTGAGISTRSG